VAAAATTMVASAITAAMTAVMMAAATDVAIAHENLRRQRRQ